MEGSRPARTDDLPRMAELCRQGMEELVALRGGDLYRRRQAAQVSLEDGLAAALTDGERTVLVGTIGSEVVGYGMGHREALVDGGRVGLVEALYVEPEARAVGVGEALMEAMAAWFVAEGCEGVDAVALPGHRAAKSFFESAGFKARLLVMHRPLAPGGQPTS